MADKLPSGAKSSSTLSNGNLLSSPPRSTPGKRNKERRNPSITPRKFTRFFTPRSRVSDKPSAARKALRDLTAPDLNRGQTPSSPLKPIGEELNFESLPNLNGGHNGSKRRKMQHTPERVQGHLPSPANTSPVSFSSPSASRGLQSPIRSLRMFQSSQDVADMQELVSEDEEMELPTEPTVVRRPLPVYRRGFGAQLLQRMTGDMPSAGVRTLDRPVSDWRAETANFYSQPDLVHEVTSHEGAPRAIPFCTASCNKNSLVAVGDEEGYVRLLDSNHEFGKIHLSFPAHGNAIIDLTFSEDDYLLATASGDQTGRVIDMMTQTPVSILGQHTASLKQVRFQPGRGSGAVLATSGRDGSVQIWDLRCRGGPVQDIGVVRHEPGLHARLDRPVTSGCVVNSIYDAHARMVTKRPRGDQQSGSGSADVARTGEVPGRAGEVSVTAIQFLPPGREHLLLSACEADASVKLWDIRAIHSSRHHKTSTPISFTTPPTSHTSWRPFGISSMALGGDGSRLYTVCKDNTVYAYSTAHLVLGHAPELTAAKPGEEPPRRRHINHGVAHEGLGPLYGLRHPLFHATSFYVKASVRPARDGRSELLAVGSSDGSAVLFPTDERYLRDYWQRQEDRRHCTSQPSLPSPETPSQEQEDEERYYIGNPTAEHISSRRPTSSRNGSLPRSDSFFSSSFSGRLQQNQSIPIVRSIGTPLVRGHDKEVGALTWTHDGSLVTVGDDFLVRCWREDRERAADLRTGGEAGGRRWGCGWADVGDTWNGDFADEDEFGGSSSDMIAGTGATTAMAVDGEDDEW